MRLESPRLSLNYSTVQVSHGAPCRPFDLLRRSRLVEASQLVVSKSWGYPIENDNGPAIPRQNAFSALSPDPTPHITRCCLEVLLHSFDSP